MGTTDALIAAAVAAVALLALATLATMRARSKADRRLYAALGQIGQSVSHLSETLGDLAVRASAPGPAVIPPRGLSASLDIAEVAEAVAVAARALQGVEAAAVQAVLENDDVVLGAVGVPQDSVRRMAIDPPDDTPFEAAHLHWDRRPANGTGRATLTTALVVPLEHHGVRVGTLLAFTSEAGFPTETETSLVRLAASSVPAVVNARRYHATLDLVRTDSLTGLRNRRAYDEELALEIERARRGGTPLSLLLIDLDDFGQVNKRFSLQVGDDVLSAFAAVLRTTARTIDAVCRRGGEEFVVVLPDTACREAQKFYARLRHEVALTEFPTIGRLTFSAGLTHLDPEDTAETIDERASHLMNQSKQTGKDKVTHDCS